MYRIFFLIIFISNLSAIDVEGFSAPSADATLSFVRSGQVVEINVKEGDEIKPGQVLAKLDDSLEKAKLSQLQAELEHDVKVKAEEAKLKQKKADLQAMQNAAKEGAASKKDVGNALLEVVQLEYSLKLFDFEKAQIKRKIVEQKLLQEQTKLIALEKGIVESVNIARGESVERLKEIIRVVVIDPLWIEVNIPLLKSQSLKIGSKLPVIFPGEKGKEIEEVGEVIFRSSIADPGSETLKFRLKVPNKAKRIAGERVKVRLKD